MVFAEALEADAASEHVGTDVAGFGEDACGGEFRVGCGVADGADLFIGVFSVAVGVDGDGLVRADLAFGEGGGGGGDFDRGAWLVEVVHEVVHGRGRGTWFSGEVPADEGAEGHGGRFEEDDDDGVRVHASDAEGVWSVRGEVIDFLLDDLLETGVDGEADGAALGGLGGGAAVGCEFVAVAVDFDGAGAGGAREVEVEGFLDAGDPGGRDDGFGVLGVRDGEAADDEVDWGW